MRAKNPRKTQRITSFISFACCSLSPSAYMTKIKKKIPRNVNWLRLGSVQTARSFYDREVLFMQSNMRKELLLIHLLRVAGGGWLGLGTELHCPSPLTGKYTNSTTVKLYASHCSP